MIADQARGRLRRILRACRAQLPARRGPARARVRRRAVPVQGHDAARGLQPQPLRARPRGDAGQRGPAGLPRVGARAALRRTCRQVRSASSAWRSRPKRRPARLAGLQAAQAAGARGRREVLCTDPYVAGRPRSCRSSACSPRRTCCSSARRTAPTAASTIGGKPVVDVWSCRSGPGGSRAPSEDPRHRLGRVHRRLSRRRSCSRRGHEVVGLDNFSQVRPRRAESTTTTRATASSRATPRTWTSLRELLADCDHFVAGAAMIGGITLLPRVRLRPARRERADHRRRRSTPPSRAHQNAASSRRSPSVSSSMVFENADRLPDARRRTSGSARRRLDLRLPEAGLRVLRPGRLGAVRAAVHDRAGRSTASAIGERRALRRHGDHSAATSSSR